MKMFASFMTFGADDPRTRARRGWASVAAFAMALLLAALCGAPRVHAQAPANIYGVGLSANPGQSPSVSGTALWAHQVTSNGTYAGAIVDFLPQTVKPIVVNTNVGAFVAQKVATVAGHDVFATGSTGISVSGGNTGWNYTGGGAVFFKLPKPNWFLSANVRFSKSTVAGATGFQLIPGVQVNWGQ